MVIDIKKRNFYFDNVRFALIFLVVLGHFLGPLTNKGAFVATISMFIYFFHMPLFIFLVGLFTKNIERDDYQEKIIRKSVIPYLIF